MGLDEKGRVLPSLMKVLNDGKTLPWLFAASAILIVRRIIVFPRAQEILIKEHPGDKPPDMSPKGNLSGISRQKTYCPAEKL